jgi:3-deoxy-D-manno-octulosonic-acid transferase
MLDFINRWFFNVIYLTFFILAWPWMCWRIFKGKSRRGWAQKMFGLVPARTSNARCLWFHAVSVGEVNLLAPVIAELSGNHPEFEIVISTSTQTGFELAKKKYSTRAVFFCPCDFSWAVANAIRRIRPSAMVLAELELWPNMIRMAHWRGIPVVVVNGRLSEKSFRGYQRFSWFTRPIFGRLNRVLAQTPEYADRFRTLGCPAGRVSVSGSVKFDGVHTDPNNPRTRELAKEAGFEEDDFVFVAGSTQPLEDDMAADVFAKLSPEYPRLKMVLVPRHPERSMALQKKLAGRGIAAVLRTELAASQREVFVLIVDVIGELGSWWGRADCAYVGGSMGDREGQNMIEPAAYGVPVCFGPRTKNFRDVVSQLLQADAATVVQDADQIGVFLGQCISSPRLMGEMGRRAQNVVEANRGAAKITANNVVLSAQDSVFEL